MVYNSSIAVKGNERRIMVSEVDLKHEFADLTSLLKILDWMHAKQLPLDQLDMVAQDEFCHDLYVPWQDRWLIFGLT